MRVASTLLLLSSLLGSAFASPAPIVDADTTGDGTLDKRFLKITVDAPAGTIVGRQDLLTEDFNGIPFAHAPVGNLRLRPPQRREDRLENFDGTTYAPACPQFINENDSGEFLDKVVNLVTDSPLFKVALKISEDCLNLNVIRPKGTKAGDNLPVLFWMYGGGFSLGWNSMYDASGMVIEAIKAGKPYVFVAVNYRVGAWGFLAGKDLAAEGSTNLGHLDQRMGLEWVADNIAAFGGDPSKVTIWGESAGAISVFHQMAAYDGDNNYKGKPLFRGAIMNSGSMIPVEPVDGVKAQSVYETLLKEAGCFEAEDRLGCLRALPLDAFTRAANSFPGMLSYTAVALHYVPRPDGRFLTASPHVLAREKRYSPVPYILGDQEDEGTLFSLFQKNTTGSTDKIVNYLQELYFMKAPRETIVELVQAYPESSIAGSPFRTGIFNEIFPGFKRLAALLGDVTFTITRRLFLEQTTAHSPELGAWSYIASYGYLTPILGSFHASDLIQIFFGLPFNYASINVRKYYANFVYNLDPNDSSGGNGKGSSKVNFVWPRWTNSNRVVINFYDLWFKTLTDDFRSKPFEVIKKNLDYYLN